ncbi:uncharacterized protein LOC143459683 isoform X2 [Clavelina lepadiformis]|uniref:Uncharacterized protein n=1 Tax=Clavelina lepadiformis TaxID=159417 RepID=A0ABP0FSH7_CLALP
MASGEEPVQLQVNLTVNKQDQRTIGMHVQHAEHIEHHSRESSASNATAFTRPKFNDSYNLYESFKKKGDFKRAYQVVFEKYVLGPAYRGELLVELHKMLLFTEQTQNAAKTRQELIELIRTSITTTPEEIQAFAWQLSRKPEALFNSMTFYYVAAFFYSASPSPVIAVMGIESCVECMQGLVINLLKADSRLGSIIRDQVIPMIYEMKEMVFSVDGASKADRCKSATCCVHSIEYCHLIVGDHEGREKVLKEALSAMHKCFGAEYNQHLVVGLLRNNLAYTYACMSRMEEAEQYFQLAIKTYKDINELNNPELISRCIKRSEASLKMIQRMKQ